MFRIFSKNLIIKVSGAFFLLFLSYYLNKITDIETFGRYTFIKTIVNFSTIISLFSIPQLIVNEFPGLINSSKIDNLNKKIQSYHFFHYLFLFFLFFVLIFVGNYYDFSVAEIFIIFMLVLFQSKSKLRMTLLRVFKSFVYSELPDLIIRPVIFILLLSIFFYSGLNINVINIIICYLGGTFISYQIGELFLKNNKYYNNLNLKIDSKLKAFVKKAYPFLLFTIMLSFKENSEIFLLSIIDKYEYISLFSVYFSFSLIIIFPLMASNVSLTPAISSLIYNNNLKEIIPKINSYKKFYLPFCIIIWLALILFGEYILENLYPPEYIVELNSFKLILSAQLIYCITGPFNQILLILKKTKELLYILSFSIMINAISVFFFVENYGFICIALSFFSTSLITQLYYIIYLKKIIKISVI